MFFSNINEKKTLAFINDLIRFLVLNDEVKLRVNVIEKNDGLAFKKNYGFYKYVGQEHNIFLNIPYILNYVNHMKDKMDMETYYAFLTLIVIHEYRHFMQGKAIYNGKMIDGFNNDDLINTERIFYIKFFYDAYHYYNKNNFKYELDALKYAIINGTKYLDEKYPNINANRAILNALRIYESEFLFASTDDVISKIDERISSPSRVSLNDSLVVVNTKMYGNHGYYGLEHEKLLNDELISRYDEEKDAQNKDKILYDAILTTIDKPYDSIKKYPALRKEYIINNYRKKKK